MKKRQRHPIVLTCANCLHKGVFFVFFSSAPVGFSGSGWFLRNPPLKVLLLLRGSLSCGANSVKNILVPGSSQRIL